MDSPPDWRVTVTALAPAGLSDEQREEVVLNLHGFPTLLDDVGGRLVVEFDREAESAEEAMERGRSEFSRVGWIVFDGELPEVEVTGAVRV